LPWLVLENLCPNILGQAQHTKATNPITKRTIPKISVFTLLGFFGFSYSNYQTLKRKSTPRHFLLGVVLVVV
jgi:hypothetical protein